MIDLRLNRKRLNQHWHYYRARYLVFLVAALFAANLLYSMTRPQTPYEQKVDVIVVSGAIVENDFSKMESELLCALPTDQKEASMQIVTLMEGQEYTIFQAVAARMSAQEGTIWILPKDMFVSMASQGTFIALDGQTGRFRLPEGTDLSGGKALVKMSDEDPGLMQLCGIPLDGATGLAEQFLPEGMVMAFPVYAQKNYENAVVAANWLLSHTDAPRFLDTTAEPGTRVNVAVAALAYAENPAEAWEAGIASALPEGQTADVSAFTYVISRETTVAEAVKELRKDKLRAYGLCVVPDGVFRILAREGALSPLDEDLGALGLSGADLSAGMESARGKNGEPGPARQYGIPLDAFTGLSSYFNPKGMVLAVPAQPGNNRANAVKAAEWILTEAAAK